MEKIFEIIEHIKTRRLTGKTIVVITHNQGGITGVEEFRKK